MAGYAAQLIDSEVECGRLPAGGVAVRFLDYDWSLNDTPLSNTHDSHETHDTHDTHDTR